VRLAADKKTRDDARKAALEPKGATLRPAGEAAEIEADVEETEDAEG